MADLPFELKEPSLFHTKALIHGEWITGSGEGTFAIEDPGTGQTWTHISTLKPADVPAAISSAHQAFETYRKFTPAQRSHLIRTWDSLIRHHSDDIAQIITHETGKPLAEARAELVYATSFTAWFAGEAERIRGTVFASNASADRRVWTYKVPLGVSVALVPWNFPVAMILRKAAAALAAGCTMVFKPSPETAVSTLAVAGLALEAGFPAGVINVVTTDLENTPAVSEALCRHPLVKKVSFTGSTRVGKIVGRWCADELKKVTLELGGNCPFVVFDDADLEAALEQLMALKWRHAGQACITANRVYVQRGVYERFMGMFVKKTNETLVQGHGAEQGTTIGPLTTGRGVEKAKRLVEDALTKGARNMLSGTQASGGQVAPNGHFFPATILADIKPDMQLASEELFAPVAAFCPFDTEEEAIRLANDTSMGLASYAFTKDAERVWRLFERLDAGMVGLNVGNASACDAPFGGMNDSGYGKESGKDVAVDEYMVTKTGTMLVRGL